ncbi:unnamed protein product [Allacma fusca]|uniref:isoleucine--tRNA ligase n=1 Tax=Allacma fusca TaxID=39272 RepID=A0A8J2JM02_9HEXA|nr:unnamed protein product [Allacma fusca]
MGVEYRHSSKTLWTPFAYFFPVWVKNFNEAEMKLFLIRLQLINRSKLETHVCRRFCTIPSKGGKIKYKDTLLLPKTKFPQKISPAHRKKHEESLAANLQFDHLYGFQRLWRQDCPEYILHDGPPYANGDVHIGHAVNKVLKDITNRYKLLRGFRVNYTPGWDCHGLPIELKALKDNMQSKSSSKEPLIIRKKAREVANESVNKQMNSFRRWGVMADWNNCYKTFDKKYIQMQLQSFYQLYKKNLVYRELKPVFWSPSSKTALAEAELEYNPRHESTSVLLSFRVCSDAATFTTEIGKALPKEYEKYSNSAVEVVVWTTTPWSIPSNAAVAYRENKMYSLLFYENTNENIQKFYIVASECLPRFQATTQIKFAVVSEFEGSYMGHFKYKHPWFEELSCPFLAADYVTMEKGTGLVHTAPAHGADDYVLGLKHKLPIECYINDEGNFDSRIKQLSGLNALTMGTSQVLKILESSKLHEEKYIHPYPYDWRTKKPVIVKTSMQWFMDTNKIKSLAVSELEQVGIHPNNVQHGMINQLVSRPYWCISRQRVWGVPIPVLYHKETGEPLVHKAVIDGLCVLVENSGNADGWWDVPVGTLIQNDELATQYEKGKDIFDIWLDSGISWNILGDKIADLYLEGVDQFTGWFQSSLLASVALRGKTPYKNICVHGFVVDDNGKKMSKSLGNVVDPKSITDGKPGDRHPLGSDVLRWWCATQGCSNSAKISISSSLLQSSDESVQKLRNTLRFLVSFCTQDYIDKLQIDDVSYDELMYIDQYMLSLLKKFQERVTQDYENYNYDKVMNRTLHFAATEVSSYYFTWIKDRLYCDFKESQSRKSCIYVLNEIYMTLTKVLAPVLPYLCEEVHSHYNQETESIFKSVWFDVDNQWENIPVASVMDLALDVRLTINQMVGDNNSKTLWAQILCNEKAFQTLQLLHPTNCSEVDKCTSELCDILQISGVDLKLSENKEFSIEPIGVGHSLEGYSVAIGKTEMFQCHRCLRYCCTEGNSMCTRCQSVLNSLSQPAAGISKDSPPGPEIPVPDPVKEEILLRS